MDSNFEEQKNTTLNQRELLLARQPLFCLLRTDEIKKFALLFEEQRFNPGEVITEQGAIIDKIYLIVSGTADVNKAIFNMAGKRIIPVATLKPGDAIGLSSIGMYSNTPIRLAEVRANTPMVLLSIELTDLYHFFSYSDSPYPAFQKSIEGILLMQFINQTHLFGHLSQAEMEDVVHGVKKLKLKEGEILFDEGDDADACYFILTGKILISTQVQDTRKEIVVLQSPALFGEGAIIENEKRNARATAQTDSELFVITKAQMAFIKVNKKINKYLSDHRINQLRPRPIDKVSLTYLDRPEGEQITLLTHQENSLRLSKLELAIWENINGVNTVGNIINNLRDQFEQLTQLKLYQILLNLEKNGFVIIQNKKIKWYERILFFWRR